ncbi:MAG: hypothetical protein SF069_18895 [Phycisphaerae bacterium]|nr:hypothetical protein [Phycisphaerae bacterium]
MSMNTPFFANGIDRTGYELLAQALNAANRTAKHFKGRSIGKTAYAAKALLLSVLIEEDVPAVGCGPGRVGGFGGWVLGAM